MSLYDVDQSRNDGAYLAGRTPAEWHGLLLGLAEAAPPQMKRMALRSKYVESGRHAVIIGVSLFIGSSLACSFYTLNYLQDVRWVTMWRSPLVWMAVGTVLPYAVMLPAAGYLSWPTTGREAPAYQEFMEAVEILDNACMRRGVTPPPLPDVRFEHVDALYTEWRASLPPSFST